VAGAKKRFLILAKTYPTPQRDLAKLETVCTGALGEDGRLYRLYPISYRLLEHEQRYRKWEWIEAEVEKSRQDPRPESFTPRRDSIVCPGDFVNDRVERIRLLEPLLCDDLAAVQTRGPAGHTIAITRIPSFDLGWIPNDKKERHEDVIEDLERALFPPDEIDQLKALHIPLNLLRVSWSDAQGKRHSHRLFEWEYYKVLWDGLQKGQSLQQAQDAVLDAGRATRFKTDGWEVWGLFGTTLSTDSWILGATFNFPNADIQNAHQQELF